jgi:Tfp pilus assembly protein PilN
LEPNAQSNTLKLTAEAKTAEAMLAYQRALESQPEFESAVLARHEVQADDPNLPLRFTIEARWRATP